MDWTEQLTEWTGRQVIATIEDQAGLDPVSAPRAFILHKVCMVEDLTHLQFFLNDHQFLAVPVFVDGRTTLSGEVFVSEDRNSKLKYAVHLQ